MVMKKEEKLPEILTTARFYLELKLQTSKQSNDRIDGYFMECQGFKRSQDVVEFCEVAKEPWGSKSAKVGRVVRRKIPGNSKSENIILKMGMSLSDSFWKWFKDVENGHWVEQFRDGDLTLYTQGGKIHARFRFLGGWPVSYKISDVKADGSDFQVEEVELAVDEFFRVSPEGANT